MDEKAAVPVKVKKLVPTPNGFALFIGPEGKTFVIYLGQDVGAAILMFQQEIKKPRPLTHDLIGRIFTTLEIKLEQVVINDLRDNTFYGQLHLREENELGKKFVVIDARPSDCIALALQQSAPIYVERRVLDQVEDVSHLLKK
jgi:bifunctional DNase/RNase